MPDDTEDATQAARASEGPLMAAGERGLGEYRCVTCGYGIVTLSVLPMCPMCHGSAWTPTRASPFTPRGRNP
jgi:rubrerythrin